MLCLSGNRGGQKRDLVFFDGQLTGRQNNETAAKKTINSKVKHKDKESPVRSPDLSGQALICALFSVLLY